MTGEVYIVEWYITCHCKRSTIKDDNINIRLLVLLLCVLYILIARKSRIIWRYSTL